MSLTSAFQTPWLLLLQLRLAALAVMFIGMFLRYAALAMPRHAPMSYPATASHSERPLVRAFVHPLYDASDWYVFSQGHAVNFSTALLNARYAFP
jgi:hypothetical protein